MTSGYPPPSPDPPGHGSSPFVPFAQEAQKAHHSTGSGAPQPMQGPRRFGIPPAFLGLLLALAVAVPTVVATLPQSGQAPSDGAATPSVRGDAPPDAGSPPARGGDPADPVAPPDKGTDPPDQAPPSDPPTTNPGLQQLQAVEDCVASLPARSAGCESVLGQDAGAAALYLDCREVGAAAERCLSVLRDE